ncbi:PH domain-containing protein [Pedobacter riviphilus]|uniref:PH domain-containing protein n=1 Tax=Pedobacter riviphilus TaxID=2766984 RepID=A0ABX6TBD9_9SPHI|nr:PH domain-containing protein [Pedobacter riviphilus]QNR82808.1 PH domain-containing protein [Pedobacter riviphilus]
MATETVFTNEVIDLDLLPKYEDILLSRPHPDYWKIICINLLIFFGLLGITIGILLFFIDELKPNAKWIIPLYLFFLAIFLLLYRASFKKRGYAIRTHDVIYKSGIIAESTTIVPLNRIQHIELNEGIFSRMYKLGSLQLFTAGGQTGHIHISGIAIDEAKRIRDLLLKKLDLLENPTTELNLNE